MKKIILVLIIIAIGFAAYFLFNRGPDKAIIKKNENIVRQYLIKNEDISESDIIRIETEYNPREETEKFQYMVEVELKIEADAIRIYTVDKTKVHLFGKVEK